jgi:predicted dehydrogenase
MTDKNWNRRELLKTLGSAALGIGVVHPVIGETSSNPELFDNPQFKKPEKPVTCIVLGAGARGNVYASYASKYPEEMKIVGVAEPIPYRRQRFSEKYNIPVERQWTTWEHALQVPKFADAVIITMPDNLHYPSAMEAVPLGYDLLLEKAIAQSWQECKDILEVTNQYNKIVAICHVLRYTPYFRKMKEVVESGRLGDVVSVQHLEPVEHIHMSHSFVRGNWRNSAESTPMILSKSCHDTDILRWVIGKSCKKVSSFGSLKHFREEDAPPGSTARCTDGCSYERDCIFSAIKLYKEKKGWLHYLAIEDHDDASILKALQEGPYGKCVYRTDNDVVDHQIMNMEFEDEITVAFSMEAFTHYGGRRTRIFGTKGDLIGDESHMLITDFLTGKQEDWKPGKAKDGSGHGGGDHGIVHDFIQAVSQQDPGLLTSTIEASMESHLMGFKAEESRLNGGKVLETNLGS